MPRSLLKHLISVAWILLFNSAVSVHVSQAYRKTEQTSERMSRILDASLIVLSFQMVFNLDRVAAVIAILANISGLDQIKWGGKKSTEKSNCLARALVAYPSINVQK